MSETLEQIAARVGAEVWPDTVRNMGECYEFARRLVAALPNDITALQARLAEEREKCAVGNVSNVLQDLATVTQQRDELLAAAEKVLAWYEAEEDHSKEPDFYRRIDMCTDSELAIRAAIAKVKP